jgi:hypothetical protein
MFKRHNLFWVLSVILISIYLPLLTTQLYFRHDDSQTLLWAKEYSRFWLTAFNPQLWLTEFYRYPGVGGYYRPFESVYVMAILRTFGADPFYFHFFNAILILGTFVFLFKIIELFSNRYTAFFGIVLFHAAFNNILYGLTHIVVPFGYFFELGAIYFFLKGLVRPKKWAFLVAWLFYLPATNRQTSMILIPLLIALYIIDHWQEIRANRKGAFGLLLASLLPNLVLPFSGFVSTGTLLSQPFSFAAYSGFILERYHFYGDLLTRGMAGVLVLFPAGYIIAARILRKSRKLTERQQSLIAFVCGILAAGLTRLPGSAIIYIATIALLYLFFVDRSARSGFGWFFASCGVFLMVDYYHGGYFVEAAMGLIFGLALLYQRIFNAFLKQFGEIFRLFWQRHRKITVFSAVLVPVIVLGSGMAGYRVILPKIEAVKVLIQTNKNFEDTVNYMASSLPPNAAIYQLTNEEMGLNDRIWRFQSLRERAENVKVMNDEDLSAMIKVLDRYDLQFQPSEHLRSDSTDSPKYFLVCSAKEKKIAEERFSLVPLQVFQRGETVAGIFVAERK